MFHNCNYDVRPEHPDAHGSHHQCAVRHQSKEQPMVWHDMRAQQREQRGTPRSLPSNRPGMPWGVNLFRQQDFSSAPECHPGLSVASPPPSSRTSTSFSHATFRGQCSLEWYSCVLGQGASPGGFPIWSVSKQASPSSPPSTEPGSMLLLKKRDQKKRRQDLVRIFEVNRIWSGSFCIS